MRLFKKFVNQTRKPKGFLGKMMAGGMNGVHAKLADWGMTHPDGIAVSAIVELGCGGGRNAGELLKRYPKASLSALDYSELSVEKTRKINRESIAVGRRTVVQGNALSLPFETEPFDLATAFETVYFWPGLEKCLVEACRALKPGGVFMICNESDGTDETSLKFEKIIDGMKCYTAEQLTTTLKAAGFSDVKTDRHPDKPWITVLARK
ncbi:class I SAM-dependent methyltransferase [Pseudoramibacter faecis]|uniref:class I SAM-dependent methyltransferase n=1 Tax=Pseudoramibacter faecis TaxID=3108534 RepID=UPI002E79E418|nr:class I SAM-dependent methyltransferase [Pseudoramibacter sp. HA2172]